MMHPVVVIAAGTASRLEPYSADTHKCLMELEPNVTILDFTLSKVENINPPCTLFVIRPSLRCAFEEKLKGKAELVETEEDEFGNLYSVSLAAKRLDNRPFLLLMSDHIFEQSIITRIVTHKSEAAFTVCLDQSPSQADLKEGLKLALKGDSVTKAGKTTSLNHGIDTGIILCRENAGAYINKAMDNFGVKATIADALNLAAADGNVDCVDVTGMLWKDVDTPEDLVRAREVYWEILRKELYKPEDGIVSRHLNRPISTRISLFAYRKGFMITPTAVTLISFILALSASFLLAMQWFIPGGLLVQLSSITDGVDGEVARLFHKASSWGGYLDSVLDRISDVAIVIGLTLSSTNIDNLTLLFALLAAANVILVSYATHNLKSLNVKTERLRKIPATRDVRLFVVFVTSILLVPILGLYFLALAPLIYLCYSVALASRIGREETMIERISRPPKPEIHIERKEISKSLESLISNSIKLALSLLVVGMIAPVVSGVSILDFNGFALSTDHLISAANLIAIIYFGYRLMQALKIIIDSAAKRLVSVVGATETTLKRILVDTLYIGLAIILWIYLPPQLKPITQIGENAARAATLTIFVFFILVLYDLAKTLYGTFGEFYKEIVEKISKRFHESS